MLDYSFPLKRLENLLESNVSLAEEPLLKGCEPAACDLSSRNVRAHEGLSALKILGIVDLCLAHRML